MNRRGVRIVVTVAALLWTWSILVLATLANVRVGPVAAACLDAEGALLSASVRFFLLPLDAWAWEIAIAATVLALYCIISARVTAQRLALAFLIVVEATQIITAWSVYQLAAAQTDCVGRRSIAAGR